MTPTMTMKTPLTPLTPRQQEVVSKLEALRKMSATTNFRTTRSQNELLAQLSAEDLAAVAAVLYK